MLQFLLGPSGSGKSREILNRVCQRARQGEKSILLVPEQFSFESERALYQALTPGQVLLVQVLSFTRLCNAVFREYGGLAGQVLQDSARLILMSVAVQEMRDTLSFYEGSLDSSAFLSSVLQFVDEMKNAGISPEELRAVSQQVNEEGLQKKLGELSLVAAAYEALVSRSYVDERDNLSRANALLQEHNFFADTAVFLDGFKGFTAVELRLIETMLVDSPLVCAALCADSQEDREAGMGLFSPVKQTMGRLARMAKENSIPVAQPQLLPRGRRYRSAALAHLERTFYQEHARAGQTCPVCEGISVFAAQNPYDEVQTIAAQISHLVLHQGYRYRDIVLIARSAAPYEQAVESIFHRQGIPVFFDKRTQVLSRPLVTLLVGALDAVKGSWDTAAIFAALKTGLFGLSVQETAQLENYCFVWKIRGQAWEEDFTGNPDGFGAMLADAQERLEQINSLRRRVMEPLCRLRRRLEHCDGLGFAKALYYFLEEIKITQTITQHAQLLEEIGEEAMAREDSALWDALIEVLDQFALSLGGVFLPKKRLIDLFSLVIGQLDLGQLPQTVDQVLFGAADRVRPNSPKVVFLLGANEGVFPQAVACAGLLTDHERKALLELGLQLAEDTSQQVLAERYFAYMAVASPSERLFVSYDKASLSGAGMVESSIVRELLSQFEDLKIQDTLSLPDRFYLTGESGALDRLTSRYSHREDVLVSSLRQVFLRREDTGPLLRKIEDRIANPGHRLRRPETARALFGETMRLSASKLDRFYGCQFSYFCYDGLRLRPRRRAQLSPLESGTVIHHVLQVMLQRHSPQELFSLTLEPLREEVNEILRDFLNQQMGEDALKNNRLRYLLARLARLLVRLIENLGREFSQSSFVPVDYEMPIGPKGEVQSLRLKIPSGGEILVEGVVDRVDIMERESGRYVRIVDYKSGSKLFSLSDVLYGMNLQMLVYLFSIWENGEDSLAGVIPAGVLYVPARETITSISRQEASAPPQAELQRAWRMNGLLLDNLESIQGMEQEVAGVFIPAKLKKDGSFDSASSVASLEQLGKLKKYVERTIIQMGEALHQGEIDDFPVGHTVLPCQYCDFKPICAHSDPQRQLLIPTMGPKQVWEQIEKSLQEGGDEDGGQELDSSAAGRD